ncbi:hypothetical protein GCM10027578_26850 [Spirosoma luteolum]
MTTLPTIISQHILNGESGSFIIKRRTGEKTYFRLGISGYLITRKQTGSLGNNILIKKFTIRNRPGLERRTNINDKFYFLRGADLIYDYSGSDNLPPNTNQYTEKQRDHYLGLSPFLGIHYTINKHFGIMWESHVDAYAHFIKNRINNDFGSSFPDRVETRVDKTVEFLPFQYITICFTF